MGVMQRFILVTDKYPYTNEGIFDGNRMNLTIAEIANNWDEMEFTLNRGTPAVTTSTDDVAPERGFLTSTGHKFCSVG